MASRRNRGSCSFSRIFWRAPLFESLETRTLFSFGVTTGTISGSGIPFTNVLVVDNGANLKFSVVTGGSISSTLHMADVASIQYKGQETLAPFSATGRYSHYEQGLGSIATVTYTVDNVNGWILVTADDSAEASGAVIQYYAVRRNDDTLYMASLPIDVTNGPGEGRFLAYMNRSCSLASVPQRIQHLPETSAPSKVPSSF